MSAVPRTSALRSRLERLAPERRAALKRWVNLVGSGVAGSVNGGISTNTFALTFDDGPCPASTPRILDVLRAYESTATFFVLVEQARKYPEIVHRAIEEGHQVALHGIDHQRITQRSHTDAVSHLRAAKAELEEIAGVTINLYRPPYGAQSASSLFAARRAGLKVVVWSCEAADWVDRDVSLVVESATEKLVPGGILLLHDRIEDDPRSDASSVTTFDRADLVEGVLKRTAARGWTARTVTGLIGSEPERRTVWFQP